MHVCVCVCVLCKNTCMFVHQRIVCLWYLWRHTQSYQCGLDQNNVRTDVGSRGELTHCTMEIIAPVDYMLRQPMAPTFCFVIEVRRVCSV
jgi:protein transport protein SEC24